MFKAAAVYVLIIGFVFLAKSLSNAQDDKEEAQQPLVYQQHRTTHQAMQAFAADHRAANERLLREIVGVAIGSGLIAGALVMFRTVREKQRKKQTLYVLPRAHLARPAPAQPASIRCSYEDLRFKQDAHLTARRVNEKSKRVGPGEYRDRGDGDGALYPWTEHEV